MVETVLAFAILTAGFAMFARLFAYGLKGMARADEQVRAVAMAEKEVARLQGIGQTAMFETEVDGLVDTLSAAIEPILLGACAGVAGLFILATMLPLQEFMSRLL